MPIDHPDTPYAEPPTHDSEPSVSAALQHESFADFARRISKEAAAVRAEYARILEEEGDEDDV